MQLETTNKDEQLHNLNSTEEKHSGNIRKPYSLHIGKGYEYVKRGIWFSIFSNALYLIGIPILWVLSKLIFNFKIIGKENLNGVKGAKITVSNHVHILDCVMAAFVSLPRKTYFPTIKTNFETPIIRIFVKLFNAIPIPETRKTKLEFLNSLNGLLEEGKTIHFYPEGSLSEYHKKIRNFKNGAFKLAVINNKPIIPMVYIFRKPYGIRKYVKKKPFIELHILKPIYPDTNIEKVEAVKKMKEECFNVMAQCVAE